MLLIENIFINIRWYIFQKNGSISDVYRQDFTKLTNKNVIVKVRG